MRNLLAGIGLLVVVFFGVGWYRGWYTLAVGPADNGRRRFELDVDTNKLRADAQTVRDRVGRLAETAPPTAAAPAAVPGSPTFVGPPAPEFTVGGFRVQVTPPTAARR